MKLKILFLSGLCIAIYTTFLSRPTLEDRITFAQTACEQTKIPEEIGAILSQPFSFLARGTQAYVFVSQDKNYVLKFLKSHPSPRFFPHREKKLKNEHAHAEAVQACALAWNQFREETALIYTHLTPTRGINQRVTLYDKKGRRYAVPLDATCFVVQKRAELIFPHLTHLMVQGDLHGAVEAIRNILALLEKLGERGVIDNDPVLRRNFGLIGTQAVQIDCCSMKIDPQRINTTCYREELPNILSPLVKWLEANYPNLAQQAQLL